MNRNERRRPYNIQGPGHVPASDTRTPADREKLAAQLKTYYHEAALWGLDPAYDLAVEFRHIRELVGRAAAALREPSAHAFAMDCEGNAECAICGEKPSKHYSPSADELARLRAIAARAKDYAAELTFGSYAELCESDVALAVQNILEGENQP